MHNNNNDNDDDDDNDDDNEEDDDDDDDDDDDEENAEIFISFIQQRCEITYFSSLNSLSHCQFIYFRDYCFNI